MLNPAIHRCVTIGAILAITAISGQQPANARDEASKTNKEKVWQLNRGELLAAAKTWMYQIDELDTSGAVDALAASSYPLLVLESGINERGADKVFARQLVERLRRLPDGRHGLLLAYLDIGQTEKYRAYWKKDWQAPTGQASGKPDFLLARDPDGWNGSCQVAYWDHRWQDIWLGTNGEIARLASLGYDGIYLDWIDAYKDPQVILAAKCAGVDPALEMIQFIARLGQAGRRLSPGFLIIAQNAAELIDAAPERYAKIINGQAVEDTWFYGKGGAKWNSPKAGDLSHQNEDEDWTPTKRIAWYRKYLERGLPVFTVDYCVSEQSAALVFKQATAAGLRPLVTRVSLSQMTVIPPEKYQPRAEK